jgi:quinol monooxygenase YgiN
MAGRTAMYGTIARLRALPGSVDRLRALSEGYEALDIPGFVASYVYRSDADPDEYWMAVVFADRDAYRRNADDPAQDARYRGMRALLAADPEWHDGEVVSGPR